MKTVVGDNSKYKTITKLKICVYWASKVWTFNFIENEELVARWAGEFYVLFLNRQFFFGWLGLPGQQQAEDTALWCLVSELMTCTAVKTSLGVEVHRRQLDNTPLFRTGRSLKSHTAHFADINDDMTGYRILTYTNFLGSSHIPHYTQYSNFSMWQKTRASN